MNLARHISRGRSRSPFFLAAIAASVLAVPCPASAEDEKAQTPEVVSKENDASFRIQAQRNLVLVRVVVRDSHGRPVGGLRKENFILKDNGKVQTLSHFDIERPAEKALRRATTPAEGTEPEAEPETKLAATTPERYLALFFDDIHMSFEEIVQTREAATRYLTAALQPGDRVGIFTTSGEHNLDFTDDLGKLHEDLGLIRPRTIVPSRAGVCPEVFDYQAYLIVQERDPDALAVGMDEASQCDPTAQISPIQAQVLTEQQAYAALPRFQTETDYALRSLESVVRRMSAAPGQRSIVLLSPGFLLLTAEPRLEEIVDRALRANVIINTLDSRGLYVALPLGDASQSPVLPSNAGLTGRKAQMYLDRMKVVSDVLKNLADDTGGEFFHNNNDFNEGFRKVGSLPEVYYLLGFSPQNLKFDGRMYTLKVSLNTRERYAIQARSGYFAPRQPDDPAARAKEEIEQAVFSHDEVNELPVAVHTQFFKVNELDTKLSVLTHLDLRFLPFRKADGRNIDDLTFVTALFDRDGKFLTGKEKRLAFRLLDGSLEKLLQSGITARMTFDVRPGTYLVRQVVRDSEGAQISALNRTVEIPL
ncbi:MAG: VWA domain-containing protein [Acidobacteriia bacterium]|nr:VWA domain-containing protein [Terriglobia bacterium]